MDYDNIVAMCIRKGDLSGLLSTCIDSSTVNEKLMCPTPVNHSDPNVFTLPAVNFPTPLIYAIINNKYNIVEYLLTLKPDLNVVIANWKAIHYAVAVRSLQIAKIILDTDPTQINSLTTNCSTPLHMAVSTDNYQMMLLMLSFGADVNARNDCGATPLHLTARVHLDRQMKFNMGLALYAFGADLNAKDNSGQTYFELEKLIGSSCGEKLNPQTTKPSKDRLLADLKLITTSNNVDALSMNAEIDILEQRVSALEEVCQD